MVSLFHKAVVIFAIGAAAGKAHIGEGFPEAQQVVVEELRAIIRRELLGLALLEGGRGLSLGMVARMRLRVEMLIW